MKMTSVYICLSAAVSVTALLEVKGGSLWKTKHSSTPLTRSTLLLDTFPKKEVLNCRSHFCFALSIIVVLLTAFLLLSFFFLALSVCVCACLHVCKYICACVWPVIRLLFWSLCHFNKCFYILYHVIRLKFSLPPSRFLLFPCLSLSFLFLYSSIGLYPSALRSFFSNYWFSVPTLSFSSSLKLCSSSLSLAWGLVTFFSFLFV